MNPKLQAIIEQYAQTHGLNLPPHQIVSDMVAQGPSGMEQLLAMLGLAINSGDPGDNALAQRGQAQRDGQLTDAETKFPANEADAAEKLGGAGDPSQMLNSVPQMASGIAGGLAGAISGALQPFTQMAQQGFQAGSQALQAGLGALQHGAGGAAAAPEELLGAERGLGGGGADLAGEKGGGGGGSAGGTTPAAMLGPPPTPSAGTAPASSQTTPVPSPPPAESAGGPRGPMGGMPMMPPAAMQGVGGAGSNDKTDTKRVVPPSVKNGAPVQGRITTPRNAPEVIKRVEGKPVATRRILAPDYRPDDDPDPADPIR